MSEVTDKRYEIKVYMARCSNSNGPFSILQLGGETTSEVQVGIDNDNTLLLRVGNCHLLVVDQDSLRSLLHTEDSNDGDLYTERVPERSLGSESSVGVLERDLSACLWVDRNTVIHIKRTGGLAVGTDGYKDLKVGLAQGGRRHGAGSPERENRPSTDVHRDFCVADVLQGNVLALTFSLVVSLEIVEGLLREVCSDGSGVLLADGRDENGIAEEELEIDAVCSRVLGEYMPEGVQNRCTVEVSFVEGSEEVIQESVSEEAGDE